MKRTITFGQLKKLVKEARTTPEWDENDRRWINKLSRNEDVMKQTPAEAYEDMSDLYHGVEDFCQQFFNMSPRDIKWIFGVHDGSNEDDGVVTKDGRCFLFYSGHGSEQVTPKKLYDWFCSEPEPVDGEDWFDSDQGLQSDDYEISDDGQESAVFPEGMGTKYKTIDYGAYANTTNLRKAVIPDGVTKIDGHAFRKCENLTSVVIPDSVKVIDMCAFYGCDKLDYVEVPADCEVWDSAFDDHTKVVRRGEGVNEHTKVTLTFTQLKRLIKEARRK